MGDNRPDFSKAIQTAYRGFNFRSRLEAKYATFFDLCGWQWTYEPIEFNGWFPDFAIGSKPTYVEVKPFYKHEEWNGDIATIARSGVKTDVLLLGVDPTRCCQDSYGWIGAPQIGFVMQYHEGEFSTWDLHFGFSEQTNRIALCSLNGGWVNYISPLSGKSARVWLDQDQVETELMARWAQACNLTQWMAK